MKVRQLRWRFYKKAGGGREIGNRCSAYFPGCIVCESYRYKDFYGRFPTFDEACAICDGILGNLPVHIDIERMEKALAPGPRWTVPSGLSADEVVQFMDDCAAGKIPPDQKVAQT